MSVFSVLAFIALIFAFFFIGGIRLLFPSVQQHRVREEDHNLVAVIERAVERALARRETAIK